MIDAVLRTQGIAMARDLAVLRTHGMPWHVIDAVLCTQGMAMALDRCSALLHITL